MKSMVFAVSLCLAFFAVGYCTIVGGWSPKNKDDPDVQDISLYATNAVAAQNGGPCKEALVLKNVSSQVVAGIKYRLQYDLTPANCPAGNGASSIAPGTVCTVEVWEKKWENFRKVTKNDCGGDAASTVPQKKLIGGGDHDIGHMGLFKKFMHKYNKIYSHPKEFVKRFKIFRKNMKKVKQLQQSEQGTAIYGATLFSDLTEEEFRHYHLGLKPRLAKRGHAKQATIPPIRIPDSYDWRTYNVVTPIKNQGMCGSCWAFSVTGNIEGQWAVRQKELLSLSEQELVDCDKVDHGCEGGYMTDAYDQIIKLGGLEVEDDYPYEGADEDCHFSKSKVKVTISSYVNISQDETEMAQWLTQNGPISIGINANAMQFYFGGVSHPFKFLCSPESIDHGVLIVGYGISKNTFFNKTVPYWIVKNSWGEYWGEQGYYRVYRGDGTCGLNLMASSAEV